MTGGPHKQHQYESNGALTRFLVVSPENPVLRSSPAACLDLPLFITRTPLTNLYL